MNILRKIAILLATGFGLGLSPVASGTVGTLPGLIIVWVIWPHGLPCQLASAILLPLLAIPICGIAEKHFIRKDDGRIVADEYLTFPIAMLGLPFTPWVVAMAFLTSRFFDIAKLPPARQLQSLHGGTGIVIDDVIASIHSLIINHAIYWAALRWLI
jgi:phosphatidylglycerophosphatase A